jgi:hypothetical protein
VEYTGGYSTIPADVEAACLQLVQWMYKQTRRDPGLSSERLGDYQWTAKADSGFMKELERRLAQYRRVAI